MIINSMSSILGENLGQEFKTDQPQELPIERTKDLTAMPGLAMRMFLL